MDPASPAGLAILALVTGVTLGLTWLAVRLSTYRMGGAEKAREKLRRGAGNALLVGQSFVEPGVEEILIARSERAEVDDEEAGGGPPISEPEVVERLVALLSSPEVAPEEIRRSLRDARRAGLDWSSVFDEAARRTVLDRPHLAPGLPPKHRVAPPD